MSDQTQGVLNGLKVLDLSWGIAGPMTAMLMTDHGADVTRIERPEGDPFEGMLGYHVWHRGKKNAVLDLKEAADKAIFLKLAADADVLIESMRPGKMAALGLDFEALKRLNPRLIYCSITGYGDDADDRPGYDALVAASSGLQWEQRGWPEGALYHMAGREDPFADVVDLPQSEVQGANRDGPLHLASRWPSLGAFFSAAAGISAALFAREKTGFGQKVSTSLYQGALACGSGVWQRVDDVDAHGFNTWIMSSASPKGHFQGSDGEWLHNWVPNPRFILQSSKGDTLDASPDLNVQDDPDRFGIGPEELLVMGHYQPILKEAIAKFPISEWVDAAAIAGVTMQPCRSVEDSLTDPLLLDDGCVATVNDETLGPINQVGITYKLERSQGQVGHPMRARGADTDAVKSYANSLPDPEEKTPAQPRAAGPLDGVRVLDLGLAIAGPFGCQLLSDMGAEVIKMNTLWDSYWHRCHIAYMANRGKRSLAVMLKNPKGLEALKRVIATCDVVQHNMRYPATIRLGLDYDSLKDDHPGLVYCHSRGFEDGPRKNLPGNDQTGACLSGVQHEDGALYAGGDAHPVWSLTSLGDTGNGFLTAVAICNALMERERTGKGQFVDTSIINAGLLNTSYAVAKSDGGAVPRPKLNPDQTGYGDYYRLYKTADGHWIQIAAITDAHKSAFDALAGDNKIATLAGRSAKDLLGDLANAGIPAALSDADASRALFDRKDLKAKQWTAEYEHRYVGKLEQIGLTYNLSHTPGRIGSAPLIVGDATKAILFEVGYSEEEILAMANDAAILCDPPLPGQKEMQNPWGL